MVNFFSELQIVSILELIMVSTVCGYLVFSFLVLRQIKVLVNDVQTNVSGFVVLIGVVNIVLAVLASIASVALVF